MIRYVEKI